MTSETVKFPKLLTPSQLYKKFSQAGDQQAKRREQGGFTKGAVPAAYVSGNPTVQLPSETAGTAGSKTHKVMQPFSNRSAPPTAGQSIAIHYDGDRNRVAGGVLVDLSAYQMDADLWMGVRPVTPGNTVLDSANTERSTTNASYIKVKEFNVPVPGRYRLTFRLSRSGGATQAIIRVRKPDGVGYLDASASATYNSTAYPTFGSFTLDMTVTAWGGADVSIWILNNSGPSQTAYIDTAVIKYANATAALVPYHAVNLD